MKKILLAGCAGIIIVAVIIFALRHPNKSYISFENNCIEVKSSIEEVAEKTIHEFPECAIKSRGKLFNSDFIYGRGGNTPLHMTEFLITADKQDCQIYSSMGPVQKQKIVLEKKTAD